MSENYRRENSLKEIVSEYVSNNGPASIMNLAGFGTLPQEVGEAVSEIERKAKDYKAD